MEPTGSNDQLVIFGVGNQRYALRVSRISEIIRMVQIDPLPGSPEWMIGVVNLRGQILPIVDLRVRTGLASGQLALTTPIIITRDQGQGQVGILVDMVDDMTDLSENDFEPGNTSGDLEGIAKISGEIIMLLRLDDILSQTQQVLHD